MPFFKSGKIGNWTKNDPPIFISIGHSKYFSESEIKFNITMKTCPKTRSAQHPSDSDSFSNPEDTKIRIIPAVAGVQVVCKKRQTKSIAHEIEESEFNDVYGLNEYDDISGGMVRMGSSWGIDRNPHYESDSLSSSSFVPQSAWLDYRPYEFEDINDGVMGSARKTDMTPIYGPAEKNQKSQAPSTKPSPYMEVGEYVKYETEVMKSGPKYQNNEQQQNRRRIGVQRLSKALPKEKSDKSEYKSKKVAYMDAGEYM